MNKDATNFLLITLLTITLVSMVLLQINNNVYRMIEQQEYIEDDIEHIKGSLICGDKYLTTIPPTTTGRYLSPSDTIKIYIKGRSYQSNYETFLHEWGHHVWYEEFNKTTQDSFCNLTITEYVTDYAKTNCRENFAETYQYWFLNKTLPEPQATWCKENLRYES